MQTPGIYLSAIGSYLPPVESLESAVAAGQYPAEEAELYGWTGVAVAGDVAAPEMALQAAQEAFKRCGIDPHDTDLLLYTDVWHQGPDGWQPQYYLQRLLLGGDLLAVELRHGCAGVFSAFELAASYLSADPAKQTALVVAADNLGTPLVDRWRCGLGFIVGDGAVAAVLTRWPGFARLKSVNSTTIPEVEEIHRAGEPLFPPGATVGRTMDFRARLDAFRSQQMAAGGGAAAAMDFHRKSYECVERSLSEAGIELKDVTRVAITNSSREEAEEMFMGSLKLPLEMSTWDYGRTIGHLGAADQMLCIDHMIGAGEVGPGDHILMLGLAPGVTYSTAVIEILDTPPWMAG